MRATSDTIASGEIRAAAKDIIRPMKRQVRRKGEASRDLCVSLDPTKDGAGVGVRLAEADVPFSSSISGPKPVTTIVLVIGI